MYNYDLIERAQAVENKPFCDLSSDEMREAMNQSTVTKPNATRSVRIRVVLGVYLAIVIYYVMVTIFTWNWRQADGEFLAEWPLPDGEYKLRLLRTEKGLNSYDWTKPRSSYYLPRFLINLDHPVDIHLKRTGKSPMSWYDSMKTMAGADIDLNRTGKPPVEDWEPTGFVFRIVNQDNEWANPYRYPVLTMGFEDSDDYMKYPTLLSWDESFGGAFLLVTSSVPKRDRELKLRVSGMGRRGPEWLSFSFPNPYYQENIPTWKPDPSPPTKTKGDMTVRFDSPGHSGQWFLPSFLQEVKPGHWHRCDGSFARLEDPTGNRGISLSPFEPVLKCVASVFPAPSMIPIDSIETVGHYEIPKLGQVVPVNRTMSLNGANLQILCLCGGGTATWNPDGTWTGHPESPSMSERERVENLPTEDQPRRVWSTYVNHEPFVVVQVDRIPENRGIAIRSRDGEDACGRTLFLPMHAGQIQAVPLRDPWESFQEVTLEVAVVKSQEFEFLFEPPERWREESRHDAEDRNR